MNNLEREVYDHYPVHISRLVQLAATLTRIPLEHMVTSIEKMEVTLAHVGPDKTVQAVEPQVLAGHRELIEAATTFRDRYVELAVRGASG